MRKKRFVRPAFYLPQRPRVLIVSEGEVTEKEYIYATLKGRHYAGSEFIFLGPGPTSPREIVKRAKKIRKDQSRREPFDAVWCIFDVEAKVHQQFRVGFLEALQEAEACRISLAISNPCFELWIGLHAEPITAHVTSEKIQARCDELKLEKNKHLLNVDLLIGNYELAKNRAIALRAQHRTNGSHHWQEMNPCTTVDCLIDDIRRLFH